MSLSITSRPSKTISGETSVWNAVGNPVVYRLQREDYDWNQINNNGGLMQVQVNGVDLSTEFTTGDVVWVKSGNGVYNHAATVTGVSFSTNTLINLDTPYLSSMGGGGFINNMTTRPGYIVSIIVNGPFGAVFNESPFVYSPDPSGLVIADISAILRAQLSPDNDYVPGGGSPQDDSSIFTSFYIEYLEDWTGNTGSDVYESDSANVFYAVLGARQIPAPYGGNMAEYVTWQDHSPLGRWLTRLDKAVMWKNWPLYLSFIAGEITNLGADDYRVLLVNFFGVGAHQGAGGTSFDDNVVKIDDIKAIYDGGTFDDNDKTLFCVVVDNSPPITESDYITEVIEIEVRQACKNPVLLMARNSLGGVLMWMFETTQEYTFDYDNDIKSKRLTLYADGLTINQWEALQDFITLGQVYKDNILELTSSTIKTHSRVGQQVYVVNQDGSKVGVIVIPTKNTTQTRRARHDFEIEIEFPQEFAV